MVVVEPNPVKEPEWVLLALKRGTLAAITSLAIKKSLLEELRSILTQLYSNKALRRRLLVDKDKRDIGAVDEILKVTEPAEVLMTLYLAKAALIEQS